MIKNQPFSVGADPEDGYEAKYSDEELNMTGSIRNKRASDADINDSARIALAKQGAVANAECQETANIVDFVKNQ